MYRRLSMIIAAVTIIGFSADPAVSSDDNSCWLEAKNTVYLSIYDLDSLGNILSHIWEGVLNQGDKKRIKSAVGKIRYDSNPNADASSPGVNLSCTNNKTIGVP